MQIIPRHEWGARAPLGPPMTLPVGEANLHHSVTALTADPLADMRAVERIGIDRFGRFSYSWAYHRPSRSLLCGAGDTIGAHTAGRNSTSLGIVLIGNYDVTPLDDTAVQDLGEALRWLVHTGRLRPDFTLRGHRDHKATACPGKHAYARLPEIRAAANTTPPPATPASEEDTMVIGRENHTWRILILHDGSAIAGPSAGGDRTPDIVLPATAWARLVERLDSQKRLTRLG